MGAAGELKLVRIGLVFQLAHHANFGGVVGARDRFLEKAERLHARGKLRVAAGMSQEREDFILLGGGEFDEGPGVLLQAAGVERAERLNVALLLVEGRSAE